MPRPRTDYVVPLALLGIALSIGIPSWQRGQVRTGIACIVLAGVALAWTLVVVLRSRR